MTHRMTRRSVILASSTAALCAATKTNAQLLPRLHLMVIRRPGLSATNQCIAPCIRGSIYDVTSESEPVSSLTATLAAKQPICDVIERPWQNNKPYVSAIPTGRYESKIRDDASKSWMDTIDKRWRIELLGTKPRTNVQFHYGQDVSWSEGCFIVGSHVQSAEADGITSSYCRVDYGEAAIARLRALTQQTTVSPDPPIVTVLDETGLFPGVQPTC
jgi:hypothetical protein